MGVPLSIMISSTIPPSTKAVVMDMIHQFDPAFYQKNEGKTGLLTGQPHWNSDKWLVFSANIAEEIIHPLVDALKPNPDCWQIYRSPSKQPFVKDHIFYTAENAFELQESEPENLPEPNR